MFGSVLYMLWLYVAHLQDELKAAHEAEFGVELPEHLCRGSGKLVVSATPQYHNMISRINDPSEVLPTGW